MTTMTPALFDVSGESEVPNLPDAPTARLLLPADASREEWLEVRRAGIGGSDVAGILGLGGKYTGPRHVYEEKHGRSTFKGNEAAEIGIEIEAFIAHMFTKRSGVATAEAPGTLVHVDRPWQRVNVDRYTFERPGPASGLLECKNRSEYQADQWEDGAVPDAPAIQCHWGMAVGGWDHGFVAALVGGNKLKWLRLERDEEMCEYLVDYCGKWFQRHVVEGFEPPADGLEATTDLLAKLWSVKAETIAEIDVAKAKELRARHADVKAREKAIKEELRLVENEMKLLTAENEIAKACGKPAWTWKGNGTFASKQFAEAHPDLVAQYTHMVPALDVDRLKDEQPDTYAAFRARRLIVPAKGI
ncbi:YqaJ viral recombinase family nuclease [Streptomyces sp. NBC_01763]|uniref:YqaJ viral recombinase family nuclease n=1 Tax=Streptomyces sp. NBC_01763 TaxID=2975934 RepID=UPI002DD82286|nr:YqaJ viral recombinase family protein [Streptomyces sp. NBC_01763]WSC35680.1 YqaJ viral recombinase family protein [Streptomyces sp. NBC_01763]